MNLQNNTAKNKCMVPIALVMGLNLCLEPKLFVKYPIVNGIYVVGIVLTFICLLVKHARDRVRISSLFVAVLLFRLSNLIQTIIYGGDILNWGYMTLVLLSLCMIFDCYSKTNPKALVEAVVTLLLIMLAINAIVVIVYPGGVVDGIYFIGIRTRVTDVAFPLIAFCAAADWLNSKRLSLRTAISIALGLANIVLLWVGTAFVGAVVCLMTFLILRGSAHSGWNITIRTTLLISLTATFLVVVLHFQDYFAWFINGILGKDSSLTYRTNIWDVAIQVICQNPLLGYGLTDNGTFAIWGTSAGNTVSRQAHNQWLQLLHDGGLPHAAFFCALFVVASKKNAARASVLPSLVITSVFMAIAIMMVSEVYSYTPYLYLLICLAYNADVLFEPMKAIKDA